MRLRDFRYVETNYERLQRHNEELQKYVDWEKNQKHRDDAALDNRMRLAALDTIKSKINSQVFNKCESCSLRGLCGLSPFRKHTNFYRHEVYEASTCKEVMQNHVKLEYEIYGRA